MAERRMFAKSIIDSDMFLEMPLSTQALYFHLAMRADDEGFINNPSKIQRIISATKNDLDILVAKRFLLVFKSGVIVIKHWKIHNYIAKDRFKSTLYIEERNQLEIKSNNAYTMTKTEPEFLIESPLYTTCIQDVDNLETQVRLGKDRLGKVSNTIGRFAPPTVQEVQEYCIERQNTVDPQRFIDHYEANGWMVGKTKMKDWKAAVRNWEKNQFPNRATTQKGLSTPRQNFSQSTLSSMSQEQLNEVLANKAQRKRERDDGQT